MLSDKIIASNLGFAAPGQSEKPDTLVHLLRNKTQMGKIGGAVYLINFFDAAQPSVNAVLNAGIIWSKVVLQFLIRKGNEIINRWSTCGGEVKKEIAFAEWDNAEISSRYHFDPRLD